jgi:hypothetical protein
MAASVSIATGPEVPGNRKIVIGTVTFDSSYPTGGEAISLVDLGLTRLDTLFVAPNGGYMPTWNASTTAPKIKMFWVDTTTDGAPQVEVTATTDLSTATVSFIAFGA